MGPDPRSIAPQSLLRRQSCPLGRPLGETPEGTWSQLFWDPEAPHVYRNIAEWHKGDQLPAQGVDEGMLAATEQRLRVELPEAFRVLLAVQNGGGAAAGWLRRGATRRRVIEQVARSNSG
jgi:hypothetical protein